MRTRADQGFDSTQSPAWVTQAVREVARLLNEQLLPHEYVEIERLTRRVGTHLALTEPEGIPRPEQPDDPLACLYRLHALLRLYFVQEDASFFSPAGHRP